MLFFHFEKKKPNTKESERIKFIIYKKKNDKNISLIISHPDLYLSISIK